VNSFQCFHCGKVTVLLNVDDQSKCPSCGSGNGQVLSPVRLEESLKSGVLFGVDTNTGKRAKTNKR